MAANEKPDCGEDVINDQHPVGTALGAAGGAVAGAALGSAAGRGGSRLEWDEARHAVRAGWDRVERSMPTDVNGNSR